jgi:SAM-dependent methyltransferase
MTAADRRVDFDDFAEEYGAIQDTNLRFFGEDMSYFADLKAKTARDLAGPTPRRILEYGCGTGRNIPRIAARFPGAVVTGCDVSEKSLGVARRANPGVAFFPAGAKAGAPREPFDLVVVANVLHHVPPPERSGVMAEIRSVLSPGGSLVVFEHNPYNPVTRRLVSTCPFDRDAVLLPPRQTETLLSAAGLFVRARRYILFFPAFLRALRFLEKPLGFLPLGGQYCVHAVSTEEATKGPVG